SSVGGSVATHLGSLSHLGGPRPRIQPPPHLRTVGVHAVSRMRRFRPRARLSLIGACSRCGVRFGSSPGDILDTRVSLAAHQRICPGGSRTSELVIPLGPVRELRVVRGSSSPRALGLPSGSPPGRRADALPDPSSDGGERESLSPRSRRATIPDRSAAAPCPPPP